MLLQDSAIIARLIDGDLSRRIVITPLIDPKEQIGPSSVDVRLGGSFRIPTTSRIGAIDPQDRSLVAMTCPLIPSNIVAEIDTALYCRFAFIGGPLHASGSGSRPEPERLRGQSRQGSLEAGPLAWYSTLRKAKRPSPRTPVASDNRAPNAAAVNCIRCARH